MSSAVLTPVATPALDRWRFIPPNWFAAVMGTGIVPLALVGLPITLDGTAWGDLGVVRWVACAWWVMATALLVAVAGATLLHHLRHPEQAASHWRDRSRRHFYGAPAMAMMTVGAGALLVGRPVLGAGTLTVSAALWVAGTTLGLATAVMVPLRTMTDPDASTAEAFGGWLMPVVPPMVSAATGALFLDELPAGPWHQAMLLLCLGLMGLAAMASAVVIGLLVRRLVDHGVGAAAMVPTWLIVLGPLGQCATALHHVALRTQNPSGPGSDPVAVELAVGLGIPLVGFAALWAAGAMTLVWRTRRTQGLPFSLAWWSFTFPVGTVVTGLSGMAALTGSALLSALAVLVFLALVAAWCVVAVRTVAGVRDGSLLAAPVAAR